MINDESGERRKPRPEVRERRRADALKAASAFVLASRGAS
jgi:hypothetical protein